MSRFATIALVLSVTACGPQAGDAEDDASGSTSADEDPGTTGAPASTMPSPSDTSDGSLDDTTGTEPAITGSTSDASTSGSTGEPWTYEAEQTYAEARCIQKEPTAWIEIYPDEADGSCAASPKTNSVLVIAVEPWDGLGGTFAVGPDGPGLASFDVEPLTGEVTIEVTQAWSLASVAFDLAGEEASFSGTAELAPCVDAEPRPPCE